ncbi:MAG: hypothetical protein KDC87_14755 [Planctomycetes bacterium]|nr:hypothetical protein [Planctomycetota bacterium]MCB9868495.1 hypothetical protein [Planctomycetota bacterium]
MSHTNPKMTMNTPMTARKRSPAVAFAFLSAALLYSGCAGGSGGGGQAGTSGDFVVLRTTPSNNGTLFLNESISIDFSNDVDINSADFNALSFAVFDLNGNQLAEPVEGTFHVTRAQGDAVSGRRLEFRPKFPLNDTYDDGGFRPGRRYIVQLVQGDHRRNVGLLDKGGKGLAQAVSFSFQTADGTTPSQLFRDTRVGGPNRLKFEVSPVDSKTGDVEINELGQVGTEIRLTFDQPLNPHSANVPFAIDLDPRTRSVNTRGRIFLEYDDPAAKEAWIPAKIDLEENSLDQSVVVIRPYGVLPTNADIRVIVEASMEDISGESNVNNAAYERIFGQFHTASSYEVRFDALVENFLDTSRINFEAAFVEPLAEIVPGAVRANFEFEGGRSQLDYEPNSQEIVLDTDFTQITPKNGQPTNVSNGVFRFRNVTIPRGVTVRGTGSNPMVWLVTQDFTVEGNLLVEGGNGQRVDTLNSANYPSGGGTGNCGGGNGGQGSPVTTDRSFFGQDGFGPGQVPNGGGGGGRINCANSGCGIGSGGGGGAFATQGDPYYKVAATAHFVQPNGVGGFGCSSRTATSLPGGRTGPLAFSDPRKDNDFWGSAVDIRRQLRITGELSQPRGGQGGGGGGDYATSCATRDPNFANDEKAGGGGAGGGVLIVKALGTIKVAQSGKISAEGGDGGGGAWAGSSNYAGGGGGGSGGMVVLMAGVKIVIETHGNTYAANDYNFAISADGGIGLLDVYGSGSGTINNKYSPNPSAANIDARPGGALGGLGIIQLMAPPGPNPTVDDKTNTLLDDNIIIFDPTQNLTLSGAEKERYLAWRGHIDSSGQGYPDDPTKPALNIGSAEGDMRPSPILMPAPFGTRSRVQSRWIDLGSSPRRMTVLGGDGQPRGVQQSGNFKLGESFGPRPEFVGVKTGVDDLSGYVKTKDDNLGGVVIDYPTVDNAAGLRVATITGNVAYRGQTVYEVALQAPSTVLAAEPNRYTNYLAELSEGSTPLGGFRILGHDGQTLFLSAESGSLDNVAANSSRTISLTVAAKFFSVFTKGVEGFPQTFQGTSSGRLPKANVRLRFAFHQNPKDSAAKRFPTTGFFADWDNATTIKELNEGGYRFVMYDILFNTQYEEDPTNFPNTEGLSPDTPRPELRYLRLPFRY